MTDRFHSLTIVLEKDIREDDAESLINAVRHLRGVLDVKGNVQNMDEAIARSRAKHEIYAKLLDVMRNDRG